MHSIIGIYHYYYNVIQVKNMLNCVKRNELDKMAANVTYYGI